MPLHRKGGRDRESVRWVWQGFTLHSWQQTPCAHSAPIFSVQLLALQQGLEHSFVVKETETENVSVKDEPGQQRGRKRDRGNNETLSWPPLLHNHTLLLPPGIRFHSAGPRTWAWCWEGWTNTSPAGAQVAFQLLLIAGVEDTREWSPTEHVWLLFHVDFKWKFCQVSCRFGIIQYFFFGSHPVAAAMIQPPSSAWARQQPWLSWLIPKLCPISWAMVAAIPTAL